MATQIANRPHPTHIDTESATILHAHLAKNPGWHFCPFCGEHLT